MVGLSSTYQPITHLTQPLTLFYFAGTAVSTSVLVFRAATPVEFGWTLLFIIPAAILAFMLGVSEYLLVYHTSGLTLSVAGVLKVSFGEGGGGGGWVGTIWKWASPSLWWGCSRSALEMGWVVWTMEAVGVS